jgi:hypothetical protein
MDTPMPNRIDGRLTNPNEIQVDPINMFKDPQGRGNFYLEKPVYKMIEGMPEDLQQMKPFMQGPTQDYTDRPLTGINTPDIRMLEAANGGIIGLKDGGMDDMMAADSLMFKDPSDEGEWEYNV